MFLNAASACHSHEKICSILVAAGSSIVADVDVYTLLRGIPGHQERLTLSRKAMLEQTFAGDERMCMSRRILNCASMPSPQAHNTALSRRQSGVALSIQSIHDRAFKRAFDGNSMDQTFTYVPETDLHLVAACRAGLKACVLHESEQACFFRLSDDLTTKPLNF